MRSSIKPLVSAILLALQLPVVAASEVANDPEGVYERYPQQDAGLGYGIVLGGLIAGPAGAAIGGAAGALIGHSFGSERALRETRSQLAAQAAVQSRASETTSQVAGSECAADRAVTVAARQAADPLPGLLEQGFGFSILFRSDSAQLEPAYQRQLEELVQVLAPLPGLHVELTGHADVRGGESDNLRLSAQRIEQIATVLRAAGLRDAQIDSRAMGEREALAALEDRDGLAFDRQVIVRFTRRAHLMEAAR